MKFHAVVPMALFATVAFAPAARAQTTGSAAGTAAPILIKGRTAVFLAAGTRAVSIAPIARPHGAGIGVRLRW